MQILPTSTHLLGIYSGVYCFGPGIEKYDWSLNGLQTSADVAEKLFCFELFCRLQNIGRTAGTRAVDTIFSPRLDGMNATLVDPKDFTSQVVSPGHTLTLHRGASGAGMEVPKNTGVFFPTGDCPVVTIRSATSFRIIAAHAGLKELIDFDRLLTGKVSRKNHSVVETMIQQFPIAELSELQVGIFCGIGPACYTHPIYHQEFGEQNRKIISHIQTLAYGKHCVHNADSAGRINLSGVIASQALALGVNQKNIVSDRSDTYNDTCRRDGITKYQWWSYRRAKDEEKVDEVSKRNGVLVINPLVQV